MTVAAPIPALVKRLVPTLGSPVDGEALGACRAIGRTLKAAGLDFHDLAAAIPTGETVDNVHGLERAAPRREGSMGPIPPFDAYSWRRAYTPSQEAEHRARVRFCQDRAWRLNDWERGFLNNVAKLHGNLSIRQGDRLAALTDRLDMEARRAC